MAISHQIEAAKRRQADVAQRKEQGSSKAKVEGSSPSVSAKANMDDVAGDWWPRMTDVEAVLQKHKERLSYNAAYQRDLRTIKRLGLNCTVSEYRKRKDK